LGVRGPKSKIEEQRFVDGSWRTDGQKMARFHQETKKKQFEVFFVTDGQRDRQNQLLTIIDS